jgi:hypothetical protein
MKSQESPFLNPATPSSKCVEISVGILIRRALEHRCKESLLPKIFSLLIGVKIDWYNSLKFCLNMY